MALKGDRHELETDISYFMNETASQGFFASLSTVGSGAAMDDAAALVTLAADGSGKICAGVLLNEMVNLDLTRQHINWHKDEVQKGSKVTLLKKGWVVTNAVLGTPAVGNKAYLANSGYVTTTPNVAGTVAISGVTVKVDDYNQQVGVFMSKKDADGYAKIGVNVA